MFAWLKSHALEALGVAAAIAGTYLAWRHAQAQAAPAPASDTAASDLSAELQAEEQQAALSQLLGTSTTSAPVSAGASPANTTTSAVEPVATVIATPVTSTQAVAASAPQPVAASAPQPVAASNTYLPVTTSPASMMLGAAPAPNPVSINSTPSPTGKKVRPL